MCMYIRTREAMCIYVRIFGDLFICGTDSLVLIFLGLFTDTGSDRHSTGIREKKIEKQVLTCYRFVYICFPFASYFFLILCFFFYVLFNFLSPFDF